MPDRTVVVRLKADILDYERKLRAASVTTKAHAGQIEGFLKRNEQLVQGLGVGLASAGGLIALGLAGTIRAAAGFEKELSGLRAVSNATEQEMAALGEAALEAGAKTSFSASDAARAQAELAKAGVSTADILGGALTGSLSLAAAGGLELADASTIAAQAMNIFKLEGDDVGHVADVLAAGANKSAADVGQLGDALRQGGLLASQTGLSLEETVGALSAFADNALVGSDAGTSLKTMLQTLNPTSDKAARLMDEVGFSAYDAQGNFVGLEALASELTTSFSGMTVEQRNAAFATIFGSDAVRAANVLYEQGATGVRDYVDAVNDQGAAQRMAATQLDNLAGDWEALMGSIETAAIRSGGTLNGLAREGVQFLTDLVNAYNDLPAPLQTGVTLMGAFAGAVSLAAGGTLLLAPRLVATHAALTTIAASSPAAAAGLGAVATAAGVLSKALIPLAAAGATVAVIGQLEDALNSLSGNGPAEAQAFVDALREFAESGRVTGEVSKQLGEDLGVFDESMRRAFEPSRLERFNDAVESAATFGGRFDWLLSGADSAARAAQDFRDLDAALTAMVESGNVEQSEQAFSRLAEKAKENGYTVAQLKDQLPEFVAAWEGAREVVVGNADAAADLTPAQRELAIATGEVAMSAEEAEEALDAFEKQLDAVLGMAFSVEEASDALEAQIDDLTASVEKNGASLDANTEKGRANRAAARDLVGGVAEVIAAQARQKVGSEELQATLDRERERLRKLLEQLGFNRDEVNRYIGVLDSVPTNVGTQVQVTGADEGAARIANLQARIEALTRLPGVTAVVSSPAFGLTVRRGGLGGSIPERAEGGLLSGPGTGTSDSILGVDPQTRRATAWVSSGEYVVNARQTERYLPVLEAINAGRLAQGGRVDLTVPMHVRGAELAAGFEPLLSAMQAAAAGLEPGSGGSASGLLPIMAAARQYVMETYGVRNIGGFSRRNIAGTNRLSDHALGKAIDIMTSNLGLGWAIARDFAFGDAGRRFRAENVIWQQSISSRGRPFRGMADRGSPTQNHRDHVHVDTYDEGGVLRPGWTLAFNGTGGDEFVVPGLAAGGRAGGGVVSVGGRLQPAALPASLADAQARLDAYREQVAALDAVREREALLAEMRATGAEWARVEAAFHASRNEEERARLMAEHARLSDEGARQRDRLGNMNQEIARTERLVALERQLADVRAEEEAAQARRDLAESRLGALRDMLAERQRVVDALADSQRRMADTLAQARRQLDEGVAAARAGLQERIRDLTRARADELRSWASLTEPVEVQWASSVGALTRNVGAQVALFDEWVDRLAEARSRGVSEQVIRALGLDEGPEALGQLRQFGRATQAEIDAYNRAISAQQNRFDAQAAAEATSAVSRLGESLVAERERTHEELARLYAEFAESQRDARAEFEREQAEANERLAQIGRDGAAGWVQAMTDAIASGLPALQAQARLVQQAMAALPVDQQVTIGGDADKAARVRAIFANRGVPLTYGALPGESGDARVARLVANLENRDFDALRQSVDLLAAKLRVRTYDAGGPLQPGWTLAYNGTGRTEYVVQQPTPVQPQPLTVVIENVVDGQVAYRSVHERMVGANRMISIQRTGRA